MSLARLPSARGSETKVAAGEAEARADHALARLDALEDADGVGDHGLARGGRAAAAGRLGARRLDAGLGDAALGPLRLSGCHPGAGGQHRDRACQRGGGSPRCAAWKLVEGGALHGVRLIKVFLAPGADPYE